MKKDPQEFDVSAPLLSQRQAPRPRGFLSGRRITLRRWLSISLAAATRLVDRLPPGRVIHRYVQRLEFNEVQISLLRGGAGLDGMRIVFLSDIHAGSYMNEADLRTIFARVAAIEPDLVLLGGDLINTREREILMYREAIPLLDPPLGVFAVPGNHDHFWGKDLGLWSPFLRELGVTILDNSGVRLEHNGSALWLAGVDDLTEGEPDLGSALRGSNPDEPVVLLSHHPDFFYEASPVRVDLTLSGHTHGGQVLLFGRALISHSRLGYLRGEFEENGARLYVGRGVGVTLLPIRIGARAEIPILTLRVPQE